MIFNRFQRKKIIQVQKEDHSDDLVYQIHIDPKYLMYIDHVVESGKAQVSYKGESVRGQVKVNDNVLVLDCEGNTLAEAVICKIESKTGEIESTMAGDKNLIITIEGIEEEICHKGQMLAIRGDRE